MLQALTHRMSGPPEARSGDEPAERRVGYVTFEVLLQALRQANEPIRAAIAQLDTTLSREIEQQTSSLSKQWDAWRTDHERDAHARDVAIDELRQWRNDLRIERAEREGFRRTLTRASIWLFEHPGTLLVVGIVLAMMVTGVTWAVFHTGAPVVEVNP